MKKMKISISGMHCGSCAANIERSLRKISGVKEVTVNAIINKAFLEGDEKVSDEEIKKAVAKAGYKVIDIDES